MEQTLRNRSVGKKAIITFFVIVILLSAVVETLICRGRPGLALQPHYAGHLGVGRGT